MDGLFHDGDFDFGRLAAALGGDGGRAQLAVGVAPVPVSVTGVEERVMGGLMVLLPLLNWMDLGLAYLRSSLLPFMIFVVLLKLKQ